MVAYLELTLSSTKIHYTSFYSNSNNIVIYILCSLEVVQHSTQNQHAYDGSVTCYQIVKI